MITKVNLDDGRVIDVQYPTGMEKNITVECNVSKSGVACLFESGGSYKNEGSSVIIANESGNRKTPIYIRCRGDLACKDHALFAIVKGDIVVKAFHNADGCAAAIYKVYNIDAENRTIDLELVDPVLFNAIDEPTIKEMKHYRFPIIAAVKKCYDYHCRRAYYYRPNEKLKYVNETPNYKKKPADETVDDTNESNGETIEAI